jgi:hypothetical protein
MSLLNFTETAAPAAPALNEHIIYVGTDGKLKQLTDENWTSSFNHDGLHERNIITNGGFNIQQKLPPASTAIAGISTTTRGGVVADCWSVTASVASNLNWQQVDTSAAPEISSGLTSRYYGSIISSSAGKKVMLSQWILNAEMMHLLGKKVRLSVKTNQKVGLTQNFKLGLLQLTAAGTVDTSPAFLSGAWSTSTGVDPSWGTNLLPITPDAITPQNGTITGNYLVISSTQNLWKQSSTIFTIPENCKNLVVVLFADAIGGSTDNISIAEFQLTGDTDVCEYIEPPQVETLLRCQRRYCKSFPIAVLPAASVSVATGGYGDTGVITKAGSGAVNCCFIPIKFPVEMYKVPTITLFTPITTGALVYRHTGTTPAVQGVTAVQTNATTAKETLVTATAEATANGAVGDLVSIHWVANAEIVA